MKVLIVSNASEGRGGSSKALYNLVSYLGNKVDLHVVFPGKGSLYYEIESIGVHCYDIGEYRLSVFPQYRNPLKILNAFIKNYRAYIVFEKLVKKLSPDVIHTNVGPLVMGYDVAHKLSIPHVWHIREYINLDFGLRPFPSFDGLIKKYKAKDNNCIAISEGIKKHFGLSDRAIVIYDGVFPNKHQEFLDKEDYFLFAGRLQSAKGVMELLEAYCEYARQGGLFRLLLAGNGDSKYLDKCKRIVLQNGLSEKVEFLGMRKDVYSLMSRAQALIVSSRSEGFGFITAEAMYNHCLVIGKNTAGTKEQFDKGVSQFGKEIGLRYSNKEELVDKMFIVERQEFSVDMIKTANKVVMENYTIESYGKSPSCLQFNPST